MNKELFAQAAIFEGLGDDELEAVAEICEVVEFKHSEYVFREGEPGDRLYIIASGAVRISRMVPGTGEEALTVLKPGACFGEMAVLDDSVRSTDAIVDTRSQLLTISREHFEQLLDSDDELAHKILRSVVRVLCQRLRSTNETLRSVLVMAMF